MSDIGYRRSSASCAQPESDVAEVVCPPVDYVTIDREMSHDAIRRGCGYRPSIPLIVGDAT